METEDKIKQIAVNAMNKAIGKVVERSQEGSESPIESVLASAIIVDIMYSSAHSTPMFDMADKETKEDVERRAIALLNSVVVSRQIQLGPYRVDFYAVSAVELDFGSIIFRLVIECDGHEWHERMKEQAAADKARDRWFARNGYGVLRFTGSEIWTNPDSCIDEIADYFKNRMNFAAGIQSAVRSCAYEASKKRDNAVAGGSSRKLRVVPRRNSIRC